jgi:hypothetical protein
MPRRQSVQMLQAHKADARCMRARLQGHKAGTQCMRARLQAHNACAQGWAQSQLRCRRTSPWGVVEHLWTRRAAQSPAARQRVAAGRCPRHPQAPAAPTARWRAPHAWSAPGTCRMHAAAAVAAPRPSLAAACMRVRGAPLATMGRPHLPAPPACTHARHACRQLRARAGELAAELL